jgi:lauroyl/myristoyl acyltransferase
MVQPASPVREGALLRQLALWGALRGPRDFVRLSPGPIGALFGLALPSVRRQVVQNLRRIHGRSRGLRDQLDAFETLANYAACFAEAIASERDDAEPRVTVHGQQRLTEALERGGVVIVTAHVGPWELTAAQLGRVLGAEVMLVMQRERSVEAGELQDLRRGERGLKVLRVGERPTDALPLIAHLKRGGVAAMQLDRAPPNGRVIEVPLFGEPFAAPEGPFRLASLSGALVVPVFGRRLGFFEYDLEIAEPIELGRRASAEELRSAVTQAVAAMQASIRSNPTQWFHFNE